MTDHTQGGDPRFEVYLPVQCTTPGGARSRGVTGKTRSISAGGLEILLPETLPVGTPVLLQFGDGDLLRAYVVWVERGTPTSVGIKVPHGLAFQQSVDPHLVRQWVYRAERQSHTRAPVQFPVDYIEAGTAGRGTCINLSRGGMFISTTQPVQPGSQVSLKFNLPHLSHTFSVLARVVWMRSDEVDPAATMGMGVQFLDPRPSETTLIGTLVDRVCGETFPLPAGSRFGPPLH
ncbi:MAG: TIGR02266 family protein [candidate division NC10 bacterium]